MTAHAKFSASGSSRWLACPASITMEEGYPDTTSEFAMEGTAAHELGEICLVEHRDAEYHLGRSIPVDDRAGGARDFTVDQDMADYVQVYLDYVRALPGELYIEQRVDFSRVVPEGFGTADAIVYDAEAKTLHVVDLKYGTGVRVDAIDNPQAQLYALGALNDFGWLGEIESVHCVIVQPRLDHISEWETTPTELAAFAETAAAAAADALSGSPSFGPGEACRFCKAAGECKPLAEHNLAVAVEDFAGDMSDLKAVNTLTGDDLGGILPHIKTIQDWLKAVESRAVTEIDAGRDIPGFKLVAGRSIRKWTDEREAERAMEDAGLEVDDLFTKKLISPTQAEKILGKTHRIMTDQVTKPAGKPTLVPDSDKRPALPSSAERDFA